MLRARARTDGRSSCSVIASAFSAHAKSFWWLILLGAVGARQQLARPLGLEASKHRVDQGFGLFHLARIRKGEGQTERRLVGPSLVSRREVGGDGLLVERDGLADISAHLGAVSP